MAPAPSARPGGPGRWAPVSGPSGACSGCVRTATGAPPHRGGARGESFDALPARPNRSRAQHKSNFPLAFASVSHFVMGSANSAARAQRKETLEEIHKCGDGAHDTASTCARVDGASGAPTKRSAALGRLDDSLAARRSIGVAGVGSERAGPAVRRGEQDEARGCHRRTAARAVARTCVGGTTCARTTRSAALGRRDDSLAPRRSIGVAGVGSERAEPAMRRGEQDEAR